MVRIQRKACRFPTWAAAGTMMQSPRPIRHGLCQRLGQRLHGRHLPPGPDHHPRRGSRHPQQLTWPRRRPVICAGQCTGSAALYGYHARRLVLCRRHRGLDGPHLYGAGRHRALDGARLNPQKQQTPGTSVPGVFSPLYRRPCMKPSMAVAWMSPPMTRLR